MRLLLKNFQELSASTHDLNDEVVGLQGALTTVGNERDSSAHNCVGVTFETKEHQNKYLDSVRQCCIELLSMIVGIKNVEPGIRCVLKHIVCMRIGELPQSSSLVRMLSEMKGLACQQLAEELNKQENLTLHSDGISKYGQHYNPFQISTKKSAYSLGLAEMLSGSTIQLLHTLNETDTI